MSHQAWRASCNSKVTVAVTELSPVSVYNCGDRPQEADMRTSSSLIIAGLGLLAVGCGSKAPPAGGLQSSQGPAAAAYRYARCMRAHGVLGFPDPQVTTTPGGGSVKIAMMAPQSAVAAPHFTTAERACRGIIGPPEAHSPAAEQAHRRILLAFARCLRGHGITNFPDPDRHGRLTLQMISAAGVDLHSRELLRAATDCVSVTHGAITLAQVRAAVSGPH
jgi:hypothetical protein